MIYVLQRLCGLKSALPWRGVVRIRSFQSEGTFEASQFLESQIVRNIQIDCGHPRESGVGASLCYRNPKRFRFNSSRRGCPNPVGSLHLRLRRRLTDSSDDGIPFFTRLVVLRFLMRRGTWL